MKKPIFTYAALLSILVLSYTPAQGQDALPPYRKLKLGNGQHFPTFQAALLKMRDTADDHAVAKMREHAWDLFDGLTQGETPIWDTWFTACNLGLSLCGSGQPNEPNSRRLLRNFAIPTQFLEALSERSSPGPGTTDLRLDSDHFQTVLSTLAQDLHDHPQLAEVLFNKEAKRRIEHDCLHPPKSSLGITSHEGCKPKLQGKDSVREFDRGAVVLKLKWVPVANARDASISIYKPDVWRRVQNPDAFDSSSAQEDVKIKLPSDPPVPEDQCEDRDYKDGESIPLSCFYYVQPTKADLEALGPNSDIVSSGVRPNDYLVLVALHVTTKEIPEWVWATFWWDRRGQSDKRAEQRPPNLPLRWRHFLMDTTLSGKAPTEKEDGGPKICFNPFLETEIRVKDKDRKVPAGVISNCLQCHSRASYSPSGKPSRFDLYGQGILGRDGVTLAVGADKPASDQEFFKGRVKTDFLWSIADALKPQVQDIRAQLRLALQKLEEREQERLQQLENPPAEPKQ